ncbi:hypothetical protein FACS1894108_03910 [Planctomycetales bacterium]|nr:hypothetical protein FACS1894108_03910 [Planctomycetales bacterium]
MRLRFLPLCLLAICAAANPPLPTPAQQLMSRYGSCPKGVIIEGAAVGIDDVRSIQYIIDQNLFILNRDTPEEMSYVAPVSRDHLYQLAMALARDDRIGVSLGAAKSEIVYGGLNPKNQVVKDLLAADRLLTAVVLGEVADYPHVALPFAPRAARPRRYPAVCVHKFFDYRFGKYRRQYYLASVKMANEIFPLAANPALDGGVLANPLTSEPLEPTDRENCLDVHRFSREMMAIPAVQKAVAIGEAAAFLRYLRDHNDTDLVSLGRHIMRK